MCNYRYHYYSLCAHQELVLHDFCEHATPLERPGKDNTQSTPAIRKDAKMRSDDSHGRHDPIRQPSAISFPDPHLNLTTLTSTTSATVIVNHRIASEPSLTQQGSVCSAPSSELLIPQETPGYPYPVQEKTPDSPDTTPRQARVLQLLGRVRDLNLLMMERRRKFYHRTFDRSENYTFMPDLPPLPPTTQ